MTRTRYRIFEEHYPYLLTCTIVGWLPVFSQPEIVDVVYESWRYLQSNHNVEIYGYVILENHLHWIARAQELANLAGQFKSFTARKAIDTLKAHGRTTVLQELRFQKMRHKSDQEFQLWQEGTHPKQIQNDEMMLQKLQYIHNNPVKRGYVDDPVHWRYSSARNYTGLPGLLEGITDWA